MSSGGVFKLIANDGKAYNSLHPLSWRIVYARANISANQNVVDSSEPKRKRDLDERKV